MSRVAVVTGAASGIGLGIARRFAADGHRVALLDRSGDAVEKASAELRKQGASAIACQVDVASPDDMAATCSFLCSDGGSYITGQVIGVNGGMYIEVEPRIAWEAL